MNEKKENIEEDVQSNSNKKELDLNPSLFNKEKKDDEIDSDGSASAFDETERVDDDNFDRLSEK